MIVFIESKVSKMSGVERHIFAPVVPIHSGVLSAPQLQPLKRISADILAGSRLKKSGYEYIVIDDCWAKRSRDKNGRLVCDEQKFPHGMKYIPDYLHVGRGAPHICAGGTNPFRSVVRAPAAAAEKDISAAVCKRKPHSSV